MSKPKSVPPMRVLAPPSQLVWSDERLATLDKGQLANLLANLQTQLSIGRISEATASDVEQRIRARLPASAGGTRGKRRAISADA